MKSFTLPNINYSYSSLEPYIDTTTMNIHHTKHHQTYINVLNEEIQTKKVFQSSTLTEILQNVENTNMKIKNNAGGHYNHSLFWLLMSPESNKNNLCKALQDDIKKSFQSLDNFIDVFSQEALQVFGSGWVWLSLKNNNELVIDAMPLQNNPIMTYKDRVPILGLDVWEHAYYLKYRNLRKEYIKQWWNVVDWKNVSTIYEKYAKNGVLVEVREDGKIDL